MKSGILAVLLFLAASCQAVAGEWLDSIHYKVDIQASLSDGEYEPLWLNANKYGLSSLDKANGYIRGKLQRPLTSINGSEWAVGYALDAALAAGFTSTLVVQQAYAEVGWKKGRLTVGSREYPMELKNQQLSSGSQALGINARPVPQVRLELPDFWSVPGLKGWLGLKGHLSYGFLTDNRWQKSFTNEQHTHALNTLYHSKALYFRIGKDDGRHPLSAEVGLEMASLFGGKSYLHVGNSDHYVPNESGFRAYWHALIPSGGETIEPDTYKNFSGDVVGAWVMRVNYDRDDWRFSLYADHYFEDESAMFFLDYNGYGSGDEWDEREDWRMFLYDLKDIMLGAELQLKRGWWVKNVVLEYLHTKYQSGPIYHDHSPNMSYHLGGRDNYYNHYVEPGWQHWGQVMGNPLYRSPLYNDDQEIYIQNNRFIAWHLGVSGQVLPQLSYRLLSSVMTGYGTYDRPYLNRKHSFSLMGEVNYSLKDNWTITGALGIDRGTIYGSNAGIQVTLSKSGILTR